VSIDLYEAEQEAAYAEFASSLAEELYEEHRDQAIEEFVTERLQSYYLSNPLIATKAVNFLFLSAERISSDPTASLLYSAISTEVILKAVILKPIVSGLVHSESVAELISTLLTKQTGIDRFKELIFRILEENINLPNGAAGYCRQGSKASLWKERETVQNLRNNIAHQANTCSEQEAELSYQVALTFYELTRTLIGNLGFYFDSDGKIALGQPEQASLF
jgi:hypothetical protein